MGRDLASDTDLLVLTITIRLPRICQTLVTPAAPKDALCRELAESLGGVSRRVMLVILGDEAARASLGRQSA